MQVSCLGKVLPPSPEAFEFYPIPRFHSGYSGVRPEQIVLF